MASGVLLQNHERVKDAGAAAGLLLQLFLQISGNCPFIVLDRALKQGIDKSTFTKAGFQACLPVFQLGKAK
jgi:hypothetical protein